MLLLWSFQYYVRKRLLILSLQLFSSKDEIQWFYYSNENSLAGLFRSALYFLGFYQTKFEFFKATIGGERIYVFYSLTD